MTTATRLLLVALLGLLIYGNCYGTHITGGDITFLHDPNASNAYTYLFTLRIYRNVASLDSPNATLAFGVAGATQTETVGQRDRPGLLTGNYMEVLVYTFRHTYPGAGTYTVSFTENNREAEVVNVIQSIEIPFHIQTSFTISQTTGANSGPQLLNPPIMLAVAGQKVCINPAAYDPDGDSLSYRLAVPQANANTPVRGY